MSRDPVTGLQRRGTSNTNDRGSAESRRRRKHWLLDEFGTGETVICVSCPQVLRFETLEVDRIIPGILGGRYTRDNIRPKCGDCNKESGNLVRDLLKRGVSESAIRAACVAGMI